MDESREILEKLLEGLRKKDFREVKAVVSELHPADALELILELGTTDRVIVFRLLHKQTAAEIFTDLPPDQQAELLELFTEKQTAELFEEMDPDDRADVLEEFPAGMVTQLLKSISPAERQMTDILLGYPENSSGRIMTPEHVEVRPNWTAAQAIGHLRRVGANKEMIYICYVISSYRKLKGTVSLKDILLAPEDALISDIMNTNIFFVHTLDDQEEAALVAKKYDLLAVPVVDKEERLVGIITIDDLTDVIEEEASEDAYRMAAISELPESYFNTKIGTLFRKRIIWLVLLMFAQTISGGILKHFETTIQAVVALIYFVPMLAGSAGNSATQSATLIIRGIAVGEIDLKSISKIIVRESLTGILIGLVLGILGGTIAFFMGGDPKLFATVSIAFMATILVTNLVGAMLPLLFKSMKLDPAVSSGPAITTIVDITGLMIYFSVARLMFNLSA